MAKMLKGDFPSRGSIVSEKGSVASKRSDKFKRYSLGVVVDDRHNENGVGRVEETRPREASVYMGGSPTAAARKAERMRKYSTASSTYPGEDAVVVDRVQETRPREASIHTGGSPTPAARRAERMRKYVWCLRVFKRISIISPCFNYIITQEHHSSRTYVGTAQQAAVTVQATHVDLPEEYRKRERDLRPRWMVRKDLVDH